MSGKWLELLRQIAPRVTRAAVLRDSTQPTGMRVLRILTDAVEKDYEGGLLATLIQDQEQMRNHDSRNHLPGFVRFNF